MTTASSNFPLFGLWQPEDQLKHLYYGHSCFEKHLLSILPSQSSKVFIITGNSISTKKPLLQKLEALLGNRHARTFSNIKQHALVAQVDQASEIVAKDPSIDTILSLGGGSPIDSAKKISFRTHEKNGKFLTHLTIPTTLIAAECTAAVGYTKADGYAKYTPARLWLATGMRAMDHAVESMYQPYATEMPCEGIPSERRGCDHNVAAYCFFMGLRGKNFKGGMGLSHSLGYALGSLYGIPHGETSCLTLDAVAKIKVQSTPEDAKQIARLLPATSAKPSGDHLKDALEVGDRIIGLVHTLGLRHTFTETGVGRDQIPIVVGRATGGVKEGPEYDAVTRLVEGLY